MVFKEEQPFQEIPHTPVADDVFNAYIEGNLRIPQEGLGIVVFTALDVLESGQDLDQLFHSRLSNKQIGELASYIRAAHQKRGVFFGADTDQSNAISDAVVKRLHMLWGHVAGAVVTFAIELALAIDGKYKKYSYSKFNLEDLSKNFYLVDIYREDIINILKILKNSYVSNEGKDLSRKWREVASTPPGKRKRAAQKRAQIKRRVQDELRDHLLSDLGRQVSPHLLFAVYTVFEKSDLLDE